MVTFPTKVLRSWFTYDPDTGAIRYARNSRWRKVGEIATRVNTQGRTRVSIGDTRLSGHRVAWQLYYGRAADGDIDHINGDPADNRIANLRVCNASLNAANRGAQRNNSSGYKGVTWNKRSRKWQAQICSNGQHHYLGLFDDPVEAHRAYVAAAETMFGEFARAA